MKRSFPVSLAPRAYKSVRVVLVVVLLTIPLWPDNPDQALQALQPAGQLPSAQPAPVHLADVGWPMAAVVLVLGVGFFVCLQALHSRPEARLKTGSSAQANDLLKTEAKLD